MQTTIKVLLIILLLFASDCFADSASGTADFSVTLTSGCEIDTSGAGVDFGEHLVGATDLGDVSAGSISITCSTGVNYDWGVDAGLNWEGKSVDLRALSDGSSNYVAYSLHTGGSFLGDAGLNANSGGTYTETTEGLLNGYAASFGGTVAGDGSADTYDLTADVYLEESTTQGVYTDTVNITVVWP